MNYLTVKETGENGEFQVGWQQYTAIKSVFQQPSKKETCG